MQDKLDELQRINDDMQRQMDRFAGLLKTAYSNPHPAVMKILRHESEELNRQADLLNSKLVQMKEKQPVRHNALMVIALLVLLVFVSSFAVAQDEPQATNTVQIVDGAATLVSSEPVATAAPEPAATESPAPVDETPANGNSSLIELAKVAMPWLGAIGITALIVAGVLGRESLVRLGKSAPVGVREPVFSGVETGLTKLQEFTSTTETTIDDVAAAELKKFFEGLISDIRAEESAKLTAGPGEPG